MIETGAENRGARDKNSFLKGLRAVRSFSRESIPEEVTWDILEVARLSGSALNRQPWELVVIRDRATLEALASEEGYAGHLRKAAVGILPVMVGEPGRTEHEIYDEGRLSERVMLAASAHGVGSSIG